ncbi:hypothetical protein B0H14DRAFT_3722239 [Mycena olivaceomarginata]|nr:hypothetical protein B0H14DRAFT_3722239 [Mycena olivaceomarginata]
MIEELEAMPFSVLRQREMAEKETAGTIAPKCMLFYCATCASLKISPKTTMLAVGEVLRAITFGMPPPWPVDLSKYCSSSFFPMSEREADRSGNCKAGSRRPRPRASLDIICRHCLLAGEEPASHSMVFPPFASSTCKFFSAPWSRIRPGSVRQKLLYPLFGAVRVLAVDAVLNRRWIG